MAKRDKVLKKILSGSKSVRFAEFTGLIQAFGFTLERISGSHHIYSHPDVPQTISAQPDANGQAKPYQMKQFMKLVEKYNLNAEDEADEDKEEES
jgi:predicted RNA binding protein YcfA (HicA-like mRNA interferase family)